MTIAPLPLTVRNPIKAHVAGARQDAHKQLSRMTRLDVTELTALRAKRRMRKLRAHLHFLNRTDHAATDDVPSREERDRLLAPVLAALEKQAKRARPAQRARKPSTPKEAPPMATKRCIVDGHPHHSSGCVIDDPRAEPPAPPPPAPTLPEFPPALRPEIEAFESIYRVPNFTQVRRQRAIDLARRVLDFPERDRVSLVAALLYRLAMRATR